jgi:hypothetical protein
LLRRLFDEVGRRKFGLVNKEFRLCVEVLLRPLEHGRHEG